MSREQFGRSWIEGHARLALRFEHLTGCRINVAIDEYQEIDRELPYDGTAELVLDYYKAVDDVDELPPEWESVAAMVDLLTDMVSAASVATADDPNPDE